MSAFTVSITPNPTPRRRPAVAIETISTVQIASVNDQIYKPSIGVKKPSSASTDGRRTHHHRKAPEKPRWATVATVLFKNLFLLGLLIGLVQIVRNSIYRTGGDGFSIRRGSEFERRISDAECLLKKTTKMLQVQVESVDKKLDKGLSGVKVDLIKRIDEKNVELGNKLKGFGGRLEGFERVFADLRGDEWIKREDFDGFIEDYRKRKKGDGKREVDLDEVREVASGIVERELGRHAADGLGRGDYAVASGGAMVVRHSEHYGFGRGIGWFNRVKNGVHVDAIKMISPSFGEPGQCFPLKGNSGFVQIKLRTAIVPEAVTLEHVAKSVAFDRSSAPKNCQIFGWLQKHDSIDQMIDAANMILLTEFAYDLEKSHAQTFDVLDTPVAIDTIKLNFTSNHGNPAHTCIYRLRVHGREPDSSSMLGVQS